MILTAIISFVIAIIANVIVDGKKWEKNINAPANIRNHKKAWRLKFVSCIIPAYLFVQASNFRFIPNIIVTALLMMVWFDFLFSGFYNIYRKKPYFWRGSEDGKNDAITDNFWQSMPQWFHITLKLVLSFGTAYLYWIGATK